MRSDYLEVSYHDVRKHIQDGDVLLHRGTSLRSKFISVAGLSPYSHAGMAGWANGDPGNMYNRLMTYEMRTTGGQGTSLSAYIEAGSKVDVYRVSDVHTEHSWSQGGDSPVQSQAGYDRKKAVSIMRDFCRPGQYGKMHLLWTALLHAPVLRFFFSQPTDDELEDRTRPPYCSEAVAYALRKSFTDVVRNTPDHYTSPGALSRSPLLHYMFTIV